MTSENGEDSIEISTLELEFHTIENKNLWPLIFHQIKVESMKNEFSVDEARKPANKNLNRYRDVNPYDHSRVILLKNEYSYVNASHITVEEARRRYILTQGPLPSTIVHFWLMVWEQNSKAIIMLNKIIEKNQTKCSQYWPNSVADENENTLELPEVHLRIELLAETNHSYYVVRNLRLYNVEKRESREILHYHYTTWPDFGVPQSPLAFLKFLRDIRQSDAFSSLNGPPVVHCSAGIGRSGTFCLVDSCLILMKNRGIENVNVTEVLLKMRNYRMGLIQTADQLRFCYVALLQGLKVNWDACGEEGLPNEEISLVRNGGRSSDSKISDSEDDAPPPLPPPRHTSFQTEKPLPGSPSESSLDSSSEVSDENESNNSDKNSICEVAPPSCTNLAQQTTFANESDSRTGTTSRKRKHSETTDDKSQRIFKKLQEMKKKQSDVEKWRKQRSLLINLTLGVSIVAVSGVIIAYFWCGKNS